MFLSVRQVAEREGCSMSRIHTLLRDRRIYHAFRVGNLPKSPWAITESYMIDANERVLCATTLLREAKRS